MNSGSTGGVPAARGAFRANPKKCARTRLGAAPVSHRPPRSGTRVRSGPPSASHLFGTTAQGRDLFSRIVFGARTSLTVGCFSALLALSVGLLVGSGAALGSRVVDEALALGEAQLAGRCSARSVRSMSWLR